MKSKNVQNADKLLQNSPFTISPAPQYTSPECLFGSLIRKLGFSNIAEKNVFYNGRYIRQNLEKMSKERTILNNGFCLSQPGDILKLLNNVYASPKGEKSIKKQAQIFIDTPITPIFATFTATSFYSGSHPWNPGLFIKRMIWLGTKDNRDFNSLWQSLFNAISVSKEDDFTALFIEEEITKWITYIFQSDNHKKDDNIKLDNIKFSLDKYEDNECGSQFDFECEDYNQLDYPAKQFVSDLKSLINIKDKLSRKLWISLLDAIIRLASASHLLWLCKQQKELYYRMDDILYHEILKYDYPNSVFFKSDNKKEDSILKATSSKSVTHSLKQIIGTSSQFAKGIRYWINIALSENYEENVSLLKFNKLSDYFFFFNFIKKKLVTKERLKEYEQIMSGLSKEVSCKRGSSSNKLEFVNYVLRRKYPLEKELQEYDQSYVIKKKTRSKNSPWIISFGDTSLMAITYCALGKEFSSNSISKLVKYLDNYGIYFDPSVPNNILVKKLRLLGLILDSPDSEGSLQINSPFLF